MNLDVFPSASKLTRPSPPVLLHRNASKPPNDLTQDHDDIVPFPYDPPFYSASPPLTHSTQGAQVPTPPIYNRIRRNSEVPFHDDLPQDSPATLPLIKSVHGL
ncbi:hypothetical protein HZ326_26782 [Fusarium oxysporum f. sp. albedinis]|nr:hypothetical protein HZ326_26782 [Fusarium oxysporum f. sp. albedinis]